MPLPIAGLLGGLFGGGGGGGAAPAGPVTQTASTGASTISLGSKYLGRGSVTSSDTQASGSAAVTAATPNNVPIYVAAGVGVLVLVLLVARK